MNGSDRRMFQTSKLLYWMRMALIFRHNTILDRHAGLVAAKEFVLMLDKHLRPDGSVLVKDVMTELKNHPATENLILREILQDVRTERRGVERQIRRLRWVAVSAGMVAFISTFCALFARGL